MRLLEEKYSVKLQIISLAVITISTILAKYALVSILPIKLDIEQELLNDPNVNAEAKKIAEKYLNGSITHEEMVKNFRNHYMKLYIELRSAIDTLTKEFNDKKNEGSRWQSRRDYVFTPLQLIGVVILIIGHTQLLMSISHRINKPGKK